MIKNNIIGNDIMFRPFIGSLIFSGFALLFSTQNYITFIIALVFILFYYFFRDINKYKKWRMKCAAIKYYEFFAFSYTGLIAVASYFIVVDKWMGFIIFVYCLINMVFVYLVGICGYVADENSQ